MNCYPLNRNRRSWICLLVGALGILMTTGIARGQATGACCVGTPPLCQITSAADCAGLGGIYFGDGSLCNPNPCEARGACCFVQQGVMVCAELTEADCLTQGGTYQGDATLCIQVNCPLIGACCITGPAPPTICLITTAVDCQAQGGLYQGDGSTCTPDPCDVIGACCTQDAAGIFTCFLTTAFECQIQGGTYFGDGTPCAVDLCDPHGACCIPEPGTTFFICIITTAADCQTQGGNYFGDGSSCLPDPCNDPTGACCIEDAAGGFLCIITTAADCQSQNGTYFGDGVPCIQAQCPPPVVGACCYDDPFTGMIVCSVMLQIDCKMLGGIYQGDGTTCTPPNPCAPPTGACCVDDPTGIGQVCIITTAVDCAVQNGIYWGDGSNCTPDPCNDPTGACCIQTAAGGWTCVILTQIDCDANGGMYQGDFVPCTANLCPDPKTGACCIPVPGTPFFACIITTALDCQIQGGIYQGNGVPCLPDPCPPLELTGACCYVDAAGVSQCATMTAGDCQTIGGIYQGDGVPCIPLPIDCNPPPPSGACCITDAAGVFICIITTQIDCLLQGGIYQGDGVPCTPDPCTPPDPCGDPGAGPCFTANGSPGCDDPQCCKQICAIDPFCCTVDWDVNCVALALVICAEPPCVDPLVFKCTAGNQDNFDTTDGPEPSSPSPALLTVMNACSLGALTQFDIVPDNRCFGHTFTNCWAGCCDMVQSAILEIHLRAHPTDPLTVTDSIQFREDGVGIFSTLISNLPGVGGTWNPGQTAVLFLDLGALDPNIILSMADGDLDVMIQDDTGVDYMCLTVVSCPCPNPFGVRFIQGNIDNMNTTDGPEPTTPSAELQTQLNQCYNSINSYDVVPCNACIGDSFTNLPPCIISANLTIGLCTNGTCLSYNDSLSLEVLDPFGSPVYAWAKSIASLSGQSWNTQQCTTLSLDLANLPPSGAGVQNILSYLQDGDLDVRVQDDTGIDYMFLDIQYCECQPCPGDITPVGGNGVVNIDDLVAVLNAFGPCPPAPTPCPADIVPLPNGNGVVNIDDLVAVLNGFGPCP